MRSNWWKLLGVALLMQANSGQSELQAQIVSPEVHADRRVTFRMRAPAAKRVVVQGIVGTEAQAMLLGSDGIWELTLGPFAPELYSYVFEVDGTTVPDPSNRDVKKWLSLNSMFLVSGNTPLLHEQQKVPHGTVHQHVYTSASAGTERGVRVYTPPGYQPDGQQRYPLVVLMHGYGDDESAWLEVGRAHWIADNLIAQGKIPPLMIAMPYGHPLPIDLKIEFDAYADRNMGLMEQDLLQNLLPFLDAHYRLASGPQHRAIVGLSMGGGQSLTIGLKHLDQFGWIGGFSSAAPQGKRDREFMELLADVAATNRQIELLWIGCGKDDFLLERNRNFVHWLSDRGIEHQYCQSDGGHDWMVWRKYLADFLPLLFKRQ